MIAFQVKILMILIINLFSKKIIYVNMLFVLLVYIPEIHKIYILDTVGN